MNFRPLFLSLSESVCCLGLTDGWTQKGRPCLKIARKHELKIGWPYYCFVRHLRRIRSGILGDHRKMEKEATRFRAAP